MSRWTTLPTSLILLILSAAAASAADRLPRNFELQAGAPATDDPSVSAPADAAGKPDIPKEGEGASTAASPSATAAPADKAAVSPDSAPAGGKPPEAAAVAAPPPGPSPVTLRPEELVIAVQTELKRVGCYRGAIDGAWGGQSREALAAFGHFAKIELADLAPTTEILALIKGNGEAICGAGSEAQPSAAEAPPSQTAPRRHRGG
jgi:hypothetical protein